MTRYTNTQNVFDKTLDLFIQQKKCCHIIIEQDKRCIYANRDFSLKCPVGNLLPKDFIIQNSIINDVGSIQNVWNFLFRPDMTRVPEIRQFFTFEVAKLLAYLQMIHDNFAEEPQNIKLYMSKVAKKLNLNEDKLKELPDTKDWK